MVKTQSDLYVIRVAPHESFETLWWSRGAARPGGGECLSVQSDGGNPSNEKSCWPHRTLKNACIVSNDTTPEAQFVKKTKQENRLKEWWFEISSSFRHLPIACIRFRRRLLYHTQTVHWHEDSAAERGPWTHQLGSPKEFSLIDQSQLVIPTWGHSLRGSDWSVEHNLICAPFWIRANVQRSHPDNLFKTKVIFV